MGRRRNESKDRELEVGTINIISIVDVSFVLVIFCMATMSLAMSAGINVLETKGGAGSTGKTAVSENVTVRITNESIIYVDDKEVTHEELSRVLMKKIPNTEDKMVIIKADEENSCEQVVRLLDISRKCGAERLALMQNPENI